MIRRMFTVVVLTFLLVVGAVVAAADIAGRVLAEHRIADRAKASTGAQSASASINAFPFLYHLLVDGKAHRVTVHLTGVPIGPLTFHRIDLQANDLHLDAGELISHQKARIESIASADARLTLTAGDISAATGAQVSIAGNTLTASVAGVSVPVTVAVSGHILTFDLQGHHVFSFDVARSPIIPQCDMQLTTASDALTLECQVSPVPPAVIAALSASASR